MTQDIARQDELMQAIGGALLDATPDGWRRIDLLVKIAAGVVDSTLAVYLADGSTAQVVPPTSVAPAFVELRRLTYRPGRGAWFAARLSIDPPGSVAISYNADHDPHWSPPLDGSYWRRDLENHPRAAEFVPPWLRTILEQQPA
ncbi:hypothetical protein [Pseudonocardia sp. GCM10023141]|uniref:hypothetical protein n=1 Tax=Pseudonocardia sp. GCM10023141 TaxID=3252653 RepID=UPI00361D5D46